MSNMLYACSILYKTKLPMILVFNKTDVKDAEFAKEWMTDFEAFQAALRQEESVGSFGGLEGGESALGGGSGYMGSLLNSMSLMLEEFYKQLHVVGVSSMTGQGVDEFFTAVDKKVEEFERDYRPELERRRKRREKAKDDAKEKDLGRLMKDMAISRQGNSASSSQRQRKTQKEEPETVSDVEDADEEDVPAEMVEPDNEKMDDDDDDNDDDQTDEDGEGLTERYKQALNDGTTGDQDDPSFARYLLASNVRG